MRADLFATCGLAVMTCAPPEPDFDGRDSGVFLPRASAAVVFHDDEVRTRALAEVEVMHASGGFDDTDFETFGTGLGVRVEYDAREDLVLQGRTGLGWNSFEIDDGRVSDSETIIGPYVGAGARYNPIERLGLYSRIAFLLGIDDYREETIFRAEVGLDLKLLSHLHLFGGYGWWRIDYEELGGNVFVGFSEVEVNARMEGPVVGVELRF